MPDVTIPSRHGALAARNPLLAEIRSALGRALAFFRDRSTRAGLVARRLLGRSQPGDAELADHLIRERRRKSRMDGSINGSLVETARAAWEVLDLGAPADHAAVVRFTGFLLSRQDAPGRWGEVDGRGAGFFSPGPVDQPMAPLSLPTGVRLEAEDDARFAASCIALRAVLRAGMDERARVRAHIETLLAMHELALPLEFLRIGTVGLAAPQDRGQIERRIEALASGQRPAGGWEGVPLFHALHALSTIPSVTARQALWQAAPTVLARQQPDGTFDDDATEHLALIGVRALVVAQAAAA